jgi:hypothetical protein
MGQKGDLTIDKELIIKKVRDRDIEDFDDIPVDLQGDVDVVKALIEESDGEVLCFMDDECLWKKDKEIVLYGINLYLNIWKQDLEEEDTLENLYDFANASLHTDPDIVNLIGVPAP